VDQAPTSQATTIDYVKDAVKAMISDGALKAGDPVPATTLAKITGVSASSCHTAVRSLVEDGLLTAGMSAKSRARVPDAPESPRQAEATRRLSRALAARRAERDLRQGELAARIGVSRSSVGEAERGRPWPSRELWGRADLELEAGGRLLRLYDDFQADQPTPQRANQPALAGPARADQALISQAVRAAQQVVDEALPLPAGPPGTGSADLRELRKTAFQAILSALLAQASPAPTAGPGTAPGPGGPGRGRRAAQPVCRAAARR
jgi:transcriptional regulator with XRE-family HTH domain